MSLRAHGEFVENFFYHKKLAEVRKYVPKLWMTVTAFVSRSLAYLGSKVTTRLLVCDYTFSLNTRSEHLVTTYILITTRVHVCSVSF